MTATPSSSLTGAPASTRLAMVQSTGHFLGEHTGLVAVGQLIVQLIGDGYPTLDTKCFVKYRLPSIMTELGRLKVEIRD